MIPTLKAVSLEAGMMLTLGSSVFLCLVLELKLGTKEEGTRQSLQSGCCRSSILCPRGPSLLCRRTYFGGRSRCECLLVHFPTCVMLNVPWETTWNSKLFQSQAIFSMWLINFWNCVSKKCHLCINCDRMTEKNILVKADFLLERGGTSRKEANCKRLLSRLPRRKRARLQTRPFWSSDSTSLQHESWCRERQLQAPE